MCLCLCQVTARGSLEAPQSSHTKLAAKALHITQGGLGNTQAGRAKNNFFWRGQFSWYYPHRKFQKSLQILPTPTVISFGRREPFLIILCSLFGSWGLSTCCFQHLPFKGRRKTDGHKKNFRGKVHNANPLVTYCKIWWKKKGEEVAGEGSGGWRPPGKVFRPLLDQKCPWHKEGTQSWKNRCCEGQIYNHVCRFWNVKVDWL